MKKNNQIQVKLAEVERVRSELQERDTKLQQEIDNINEQLEEAELKAAAALKSAGTMESQLGETQQLLEEETRQKLALSSKLRQLESEKESLAVRNICTTNVLHSLAQTRLIRRKKLLS